MFLNKLSQMLSTLSQNGKYSYHLRSNFNQFVYKRSVKW